MRSNSGKILAKNGMNREGRTKDIAVHIYSRQMSEADSTVRCNHMQKKNEMM